ncbi:Gypsy retrotransposon integrase-like protein 1 [Paramarasmius palmivorus]|uniref:Gypsy retrotransposon integrase-like protein 1 n=1 Tax=Paramarasmius palmivorus TaxID=297713 RepID=A0AAW0C5G1_9AGAR
MDDDDSSQAHDFPAKKRRLQNACDECRKRKSRLVPTTLRGDTVNDELSDTGDSANMPGNICTNCLSFRTECTHVLAMAKKKRGPPRGTPRGQKTVQSIVKSILSTSKPFVVPEDPENLRQILFDLAHRVTTLEEELEEARRSKVPESRSSNVADTPSPSTTFEGSSPPPAGSYNDLDAHCLENLEGLTEYVRQLHIDQVQARHFGSSSDQLLTLSAMVAKAQATGTSSTTITVRRHAFWHIHSWQAERPEPYPDYAFPEDDLMKDLINLFFENVNTFLPVLHQKVFEKSIAEGLHHRDRYFAAVLLCVCACGSRYSKDSRVFDDPKTEVSAGWKWYRQIRLLRSTFLAPPTLYELQLYCLAIFFIQDTSTPEACWNLLGIGIRCAQDLGVHRKPPPDMKPTVESQLWNRVFWALISIDVIMSAFLGRPRASNADDFDLPLPIECDDEYWETEDPEQAFKQPLGKPCKLSFWVSFLKLLDIIGFAQRTIYAVRKPEMWAKLGMSGPEWNEKIVLQLDSSLNAWIDTIPEHLKWDPNKQDPLFFNQSTTLYVTYYWVQILIHRPFISPVNEEAVLTFPSLSICANAARSCCHLVEIQQRRTYLPFPTVLSALYISAIVLLLNVWRGKKMNTTPDVNKEMVDVWRCFELLKQFEPRHQIAGRFRDILGEMLSVGDLPRNRKRRQLDSDSGSSTDVDATESTSTTSTVVGGRPMAGTRRASAAMDAMSKPIHQLSTLQDFGDIGTESTFSLPIRSDELGSLPLHEAFVVPGYQGMDFAWPTDFDPLGSPQQNQAPDNGTFNNSPTMISQESSYTNRYMAESLSTAFGPIGSFSYPGLPANSMQSVSFPDLTYSGTTDDSNHNVPWNEWSSYMAGLDQVIQPNYAAR